MISSAEKVELTPIAVIGQGYVGLEVSISLAIRGYKVFGLDSNGERCELISSGISPVENVADADLKRVLDAGHYEIGQDYSKISSCRTIIICVPTPITKGNIPDMTALENAVETISQFVAPFSLIVNESTSYPGTLRTFIAEKIKSIRKDVTNTLFFGVAPERVSPGSGIPLSKIPRIVSGIDQKSKDLTDFLYSLFCNEVRVVDTPEIAEAAKLLENTFRQVNISFINEFNLICRKLGIDTREVIDAADTKPYGFMRFDPGAGIGGHCIPVDPLYFQYTSRVKNLESEFIELAARTNEEHAEKLLDYVLGDSNIASPRILLLGVAYKAGVSDTRESPAEKFLSSLNKRGLLAGWFDPLVERWNGGAPANLNDKWDIALVVTAQPGLPVQDLLGKGVKIYDFTGQLSGFEKVIQV